jgi:hypothetical protein
MDKNTRGKGLGYMAKGWLQGWSLMTTCGDVWYIHCSYNVYLISNMARGHTNLTHVDIQGEPGGDPGVQQQQGSVQETWGESRWEEIVCVPRQGEVYFITPPT